MRSDKKPVQNTGVFFLSALFSITALLFIGCVSDDVGSRAGEMKSLSGNGHQTEDSESLSDRGTASTEKEGNLISLPLDETAILNREVSLHESYSAVSAELEVLPRGGKVYLKEIRQTGEAIQYTTDWFRVHAVSGRDGWIEASAVSRFPIYGTIDPTFDVAYVTETEEPLSPVVEGITGERFVKIINISSSEYQLDGESGYTFLCDLDAGPSGWVFEKDFSMFNYFYSRILTLCKEPFLDFPLYNATRETVKEYFGEPEAIESRGVQNVHYPEITDTIYSFGYDGMNVHIYYAAKTEMEFITLIEIEHKKVRLTTGLSPGVDLETLMSVLGPPHRTGQNSYIYSNSIADRGQGDTSLLFFIEKERIGRIEIEIEPL